MSSTPEKAAKLTVKTDSFRKALDKCSTVISAKPNPAILKYVKVSYDVQQKFAILEAAASGAEAGLRVAMPVVYADFMSDSVEFLIEPDKAIKILCNIKADEVELQTLNNCAQLRLTAGKNKFTLNAMEPEEFPKFLVPNQNKFLTIKTSFLKKMVSTVQGAVNPNEVRKALTGVLFEYFNGNVFTLGTNGKIGIFTRKENKISETNVHVIIPSNALSPIMKCLPDGEDVELSYLLADLEDPTSASTLFFKSNAATLYVQAISSSLVYPPMESFFVGGVKTNNEEKVLDSFSLELEKFLEVIRLAAAVAHERTREITLNYNHTEGDPFGKLVVSARSDSGTGQTEPLQCTHRKGESFEISVNCDCVEKIASTLNSKQVIINHNGVENSPFTMTGDGSGEIFVGTMTGRINKFVEESESSETSEGGEEVSSDTPEVEEEVAVGADGDMPNIEL
jgi:DNA polymerase III sliding clamp (beta) subunit (PCNA family)